MFVFEIGSSVVATEWKRVIPYLTANLIKNKMDGKIRVVEFDWNECENFEVIKEKIQFDLIVASDITVFPHDVPFVVKLINLLLNISPHAIVFIGNL